MFILIRIIIFLALSCNVIYAINIKPINYVRYKSIRNLFFNFYKNYVIIKENDYSLEHIVPQSIYKKNQSILKRDLHNIILYPNKINLHRSNYKYISDLKIYPKSKILDSRGNEIQYIEPILNNDIYIKTNELKSFYPACKYRGLIARSSMYFANVYPEYQEQIFKNVIDPYTILMWHHEYPISKFELNKNKFTYELQGNQNFYIIEPKLLVSDMENILGENLNIYRNFKF